MKTRAMFIVIALLAAGICSLAQSPPLDRGPTALTIVVDTSWSCDRLENDFRTLGRQAISVLQPGDYVEIVATKPSQCTIALAHTVKKADAAEAKAIYDVLARIEAGFLSDADVAGALGTTCIRLTELCAKRRIARVATMILSDGQLSNSQVQRLLVIADQYKERGWSLYMTGARSSTATGILLAANRGRLTYSLVNEANPGLWLTRKVEPAPTAPPERGGQTGRQPPEQPTSPLRSGSKEIQDKPQDSSPAQRLVEVPGYNITTRIDTAVGPLPQSPEAAALPGPGGGPAAPSAEKGKSATLSTPKDVNRPPDRVGSAKGSKEKAGSEPKPPLWTQMKHALGHIWPWLIGGICAVPLIVAGYVFVSGKSKAERISKRLQGYLKAKKSSNDAMLVAALNGQTRRLGRLSRLGTVYVGSGARNTLRVTEKGVSDRHLCLYQKAGRLMVQNLSRNPVAVSGSPLEPKGKRAMALPSVVELTPSVKLRLSLLQANDSATGTGSDAHDPNKQQ